MANTHSTGNTESAQAALAAIIIRLAESPDIAHRRILAGNLCGLLNIDAATQLEAHRQHEELREFRSTPRYQAWLRSTLRTMTQPAII